MVFGCRRTILYLLGHWSFCLCFDLVPSASPQWFSAFQQYSPDAWRWHLLLTGAEPMRIYVGFDTRADELLIGCLGAVLLPAQLTPTMTRYGGLAALVALIAIAFYAKAYYVSPTVELMDFAVLMTAVTLLTLMLILNLATNAGGPLSGSFVSAARICRLDLLMRIYLWHWPLLEIAKDIGFDRLLDKLIIGGLGAFLMAAISYHYVERPVLRLKRLFATAADNRDASSSCARPGPTGGRFAAIGRQE